MKKIESTQLIDLLKSIKKHLIEPYVKLEDIKSGNFLKEFIISTEKRIENEALDKYDIDEKLLKIISLTKTINNLIAKDVKGLNNRVEELTKDEKLFEKTFFELLIANYLLALNKNIQFLETRSDDGLKTPEMLFDNSVEIECKMKDKITSRDFKNMKAFEKIEKELNNYMNNSGNYSGIRIVFDKDIPEDAIDELIKITKQGIDTKQSGIIKNEKLKLSITLSSMIKSNTPFQGTGIHWGTEFSDDADFFSMEFQMMKPNKELTIFSKVYAHSYKINHPPDRIQGIINTIKSAKKQFAGDKAGIIFINLNKSNFKFDKPFRERLKPIIEKLLTNNTRISGIVFIDDEIIIDKGQYGLSIDYMVNENAKFEIPKKIIEYFNKTLRKESTFAKIGS